MPNLTSLCAHFIFKRKKNETSTVYLFTSQHQMYDLSFTKRTSSQFQGRNSYKKKENKLKMLPFKVKWAWFSYYAFQHFKMSNVVFLWVNLYVKKKKKENRRHSKQFVMCFSNIFHFYVLFKRHHWLVVRRCTFCSFFFDFQILKYEIKLHILSTLRHPRRATSSLEFWKKANSIGMRHFHWENFE